MMIFSSFSSDRCRRFLYACADFLTDQKDRLPLWLPVFFATGVGVCFRLPSEPSPWLTAAFFLCSAFLVRDTPKNTLKRWGALFLCAFCFGFATAQVRTFAVSRPKIKIRSGVVHITASVEETRETPAKDAKLILKSARIDGFADWKTPEKLLLTLPSAFKVPSKGDVVSVSARLTTPRAPETLDGFDYARSLYFQKIGATGKIVEAPKILRPSPRRFLRERINEKIDAVLSADTGGVAKALVTGGSSVVPERIARAYRDAGIAHVLSVSGLHMSLLAGLAFAFVRTGLAFFPRVALYHDTKKIAAVCALTLCLFYLFVSGASVPAQRAFVMIAIALTAVLLNRRAISVTSIGWAAFFLLLFRPEALLSIGFQLSFAAVAAIVCAAEAAVNRYTRLSAKKEGVGFYLLSCFTGVCLTTLIASVATAPFTMFHFSRLPVHALIGNLLCSAAVGFWVMPCLTAAALTMPFGWESPLLVLAGYGIGFINRAAMFTANLPHAVADFPPMPFWGLIVATFGGLWLCLWRGKVRLWGVLPFCSALASPFLTPSPAAVITETAALVRNNQGIFVPAEDCPYGYCRITANGRAIGFARGKIGAFDACAADGLDVLFLGVRFDELCKAARVVTRRSIEKAGAFYVYSNGGGLKIKPAGRGFRPWSTAYPTVSISTELSAPFKPRGNGVSARIERAD